MPHESAWLASHDNPNTGYGSSRFAKPMSLEDFFFLLFAALPPASRREPGMSKALNNYCPVNKSNQKHDVTTSEGCKDRTCEHIHSGTEVKEFNP